MLQGRIYQIHQSGARAAFVLAHITASYARVRPQFLVKDLMWKSTAMEMRRRLFWASACAFQILSHSVDQQCSTAADRRVPCGEYWFPRKYGHLAWLTPSADGRIHYVPTWPSFRRRRASVRMSRYWVTRKTQLAVLAWTAHCFRVKSHCAFHRAESRRGATPGCVRRAATSDQPRGVPGRQHANVAICALAAALGHWELQQGSFFSLVSY